MTTVTQMIRGTESLRDRAEPASGHVSIVQSRYAAGTKTLMISAEVESSTKRGSRYSNVLVFQGVESKTSKTGRFSLPFDVGGQRMYVEHPRASQHDVRIRCACTDYTHTWAWWNNQHKALFGAKYPPYNRKTKDAPERNKTHQPGMCKHLLAVIQQLKDVGVVRA